MLNSTGEMIDVSSIKYIIQIVLKNIHKTKFSNLMFCFVACREKTRSIKASAGFKERKYPRSSLVENNCEFCKLLRNL